jgi:transmembrane sensor
MLLTFYGDMSLVKLFKTDGDQKTITLTDGSYSTILLDSHSLLRQWQIGSSFHTELLRGQAAFTMRPSSTRQFYVRAGEVDIHDIGTMFSVSLDEDEILIDVEDGLIQLTTQHGITKLLSQYQHASIRRAVSTETLSPVEMERRLSWRHNTLALQGETVGTIADNLNRHRQTQIEIADRSIVNLVIGGLIRTDDDPLQFAEIVTKLHPEVLVMRCTNAAGNALLRLQYSHSGPVSPSLPQKCVLDNPPKRK